MSTPPPTGMADLDQALAGLSDLDRHPVAEQYTRLSRAHEQLQAGLHGTPEAAALPIREPKNPPGGRVGSGSV